jgi:hypothetical protein
MQEDSQNLSYEARIAQVRARFVGTLADRLLDISDAIKTTTEGSGGETHARKVHRLLHDIGGNAAMLELDVIEEPLRQAISIAERADAMGASLTEIDKAALQQIVSRTQDAAASLRERY